MEPYDIQGTIHGPTLSRSDDAPRKRPKLSNNYGIISTTSTNTSVPALSNRKGIRLKLINKDIVTNKQSVDDIPVYQDIQSFLSTTSSSSCNNDEISSIHEVPTTAVPSFPNTNTNTNSLFLSSSSIILPSTSTTTLSSSSSSNPTPGSLGVRLKQEELNYYESRNKKIHEQMNPAISSLFRGLVFYINGNTGINVNGGVTHHHLVRLISQYGGSCYLEPKVGKLTHILATSLTLSKIDKYLHRTGSKIIPIIHPQYILDCIKQQILLPDISYRIIHDHTGTNLHQYFSEPISKPSIIKSSMNIPKNNNKNTIKYENSNSNQTPTSEIIELDHDTSISEEEDENDTTSDNIIFIENTITKPTNTSTTSIINHHKTILTTSNSIGSDKTIPEDFIGL